LVIDLTLPDGGRQCGPPRAHYRLRRPLEDQGFTDMTQGICLPDEDPVLRVVPMPADANQHGDVFGGWIMSQVDIAGGILAARRANGRVATIAVTSFVFKQPVFVGDLLSLYGTIVRTGRTSITVDVSVYTERSRLKAEVIKVTEATLVYVATDGHRKPRTLPPLEEA
jgi:acyl-CoA thioesterase YciA